MTVITVITPTASIIITVAQQLRSTHPRSLVERKKGNLAVPLFSFCCVVSEAR
jgi:hypothetical protein